MDTPKRMSLILKVIIMFSSITLKHNAYEGLTDNPSEFNAFGIKIKMSFKMIVFKIFLFLFLRTEKWKKSWKKDKAVFIMKQREMTPPQTALNKMPQVTLI